jgi:hypothetical protein
MAPAGAVNRYLTVRAASYRYLHDRQGGLAAMTATRVLSEEELAALLADAADPSWSGLGRRPFPAVLDTDFVRTGLHYQMGNGVPPKSVRTARDGLLRLFMEYDTLAETGERLPRFADQLGVSVAELRRVLNEDWLPHVDVVQLPAALREADPRARQVRDRDAADYPAAALAALLSPCLLLTHNYKHFGALGVHTRKQGVDGVMAVATIQVGDMQVRAVVLLPELPARVAVGAFKWAYERIGPVTWVLVAVLVGGGIYWYCKQPPKRRERIKQVAGDIGASYLKQAGGAAEVAHQGRVLLRACVVPRPEQRGTASAILRELALAEESLSAEQLAELLDPSVRPPTADLRAWLRQHDGTVFNQVRRGGFVLGSRCQLPG